MKRSTPIGWIEAAEARAVCELAMAERGIVEIAASSDAGPTTHRARFVKFLWSVCRRGPAAADIVERRPRSPPTP